jgi:hypothetical protein
MGAAGRVIAGMLAEAGGPAALLIGGLLALSPIGASAIAS